MSMSQPLDSIELEAFKTAAAREAHENTVGVVWPDGRVSEHIVKPPTRGSNNKIGKQQGDVPVIWAMGKVQITPEYAARGVDLLEDMCKADKLPEKYKEWKEAIRLRGRFKINNPDNLLPPSVLKRRREALQGVSEDMVYEPGVGLVPATDDAKAERITALAESAGITPPTASDREAARKASEKK